MAPTTPLSFDALRQLLKDDRTTRRFDESRPVGAEVLERLVELTRFCASGRNAQPLRYRRVLTEAEREQVFPLLAWAGYYADWAGPEAGERPAAYLVQCLDTSIGPDCLCDDGLQLQAITLGATALGLRCCIIKAFNAPRAAEVLNLSPRYKPRYVVAIGYPAEHIQLEDMERDSAEFKYYRTPDGVHHVPKRPLDELLLD